MMSRRDLLCSGLGIAALSASDSVSIAGTAEGFLASCKIPLGVQLYMFGSAATDDFDGTMDRVARIGYEAVELPGIKFGDAAHIRAAADKVGVAVPSVHLAADPALANGGVTLLDRVERVAGELHVVGARDVVVPLPLLPAVKIEPGEGIGSALGRAFARAGIEVWQRTADLLNRCGEALRRVDLCLSYHNHNLEFLPIGDSCGWEVLEKETDPRLVFFEVDVGWVAAGGRDPITFLESLSGRVRQLHVKDLRRPVGPGTVLAMESTEVGSGIINWAGVLAAAYRAGARQFYVEQEPPYTLDPFESAARSFAYLSRLQASPCRASTSPGAADRIG